MLQTSNENIGNIGLVEIFIDMQASISPGSIV